MIDTETARTKNVRAVLAKRQIFFAHLKKRGADRLLYIAGQNILYWVIRIIRIVWTIPKRMENYRLIKKKY